MERAEGIEEGLTVGYVRGIQGPHESHGDIARRQPFLRALRGNRDATEQRKPTGGMAFIHEQGHKIPLSDQCKFEGVGERHVPRIAEGIDTEKYLGPGQAFQPHDERHVALVGQHQKIGLEAPVGQQAAKGCRRKRVPERNIEPLAHTPQGQYPVAQTAQSRGQGGAAQQNDMHHAEKNNAGSDGCHPECERFGLSLWRPPSVCGKISPMKRRGRLRSSPCAGEIPVFSRPPLPGYGRPYSRFRCLEHF